MDVERLNLYVDGCSIGNPGDAGIGVVLSAPAGDVLWELGDYIGTATNNVAEYRALLRGLQEALRLGVAEINVFSDSELLVKQLRGQYRVRAPHLRPLHSDALRLLARFRSRRVRHVRREKNKHADRLAEQAARTRGSVLPDTLDA
jgi:ribonuclease HI